MKRSFILMTATLFLAPFLNTVYSEEAAVVSTAAVSGTQKMVEQPVAGGEKSAPTPIVQPAPQPAPVPIPAQPAPAAPEEKPKEGAEMVLIDDFLPEGSTTEGNWTWDTGLKYSGERSHSEPAGKAITEHSYRSKPILIPKNSVIEQYVYLDPNNMPKGIMLKFRFEKDGQEGEVGVYREGEEEVFVFNNDEPMMYDGTLPNAGKWEKLQVYSEDVGLGGTELLGISFVTYGGKANWDLTLIRPVKEGEQYPPAEQVPSNEIKK